MEPASLQVLTAAMASVATAWTAWQEYRLRVRCFTCPYYRKAVAAGMNPDVEAENV